MMEEKPVLEIQNLKISFQTEAGVVHAVRGLNAVLRRGTTLAFVGESGCGKSVTARAVMGILASNERIDGGRIVFRYQDEKRENQEVDILRLQRKDLQKIKGRHIAMVFQDPMTSLDPTMPVGRQLVEGMVKHLELSRREAWKRGVALLDQVGIVDPEQCMKEYAHQLSGGMRQRVVIAMALSCHPDLLICDEPTTALDVTVQARILQLICDIQKETGVSVIFITHDLGVVAKIADDVDVMYAGKVVESGTAEDIFYDPRHPYTWGLLSSLPDLDEGADRLPAIPGSPPNLLLPIKGDAFAPRNRYALNIDYEKEPPMFRINAHHQAATWLLDPRAPHVEPPAGLQARIRRRGNAEHESKL